MAEGYGAAEVKCMNNRVTDKLLNSNGFAALGNLTSCSIAVSVSFVERLKSTKHEQKNTHATTTTSLSRKNCGKQKALALTRYSVSYTVTKLEEEPKNLRKVVSR